jgi:hypothetical protein
MSRGRSALSQARELSFFPPLWGRTYARRLHLGAMAMGRTVSRENPERLAGLAACLLQGQADVGR